MFDWWDKVDSAISTIISTVIAGLISAVVWMVRIIFTNQKRIDILEQEVRLRTDASANRDEEVKLQLAEIKDNIKMLMESLLK